MAAVRYGKQSDEFKMMADFWDLLQAYGDPEALDHPAYWAQLLSSVESFGDRWASVPLAGYLGAALGSYLDDAARIRDGKK